MRYLYWLFLVYIYLLTTINVQAQKKFEWNKSFGLGASYSRLINDCGVSNEGIEPAYNMYGIDMTMAGFLIGAELGTNSNKIKDTSIGMISWNVKFGASMKYGTDEKRFYLTPYIGILSIDEMGNKSSKYNSHYYKYLNYQSQKATRFMIGIKLAYAIKQIEFGAHISTHETGINISWNSWNLLCK